MKRPSLHRLLRDRDFPRLKKEAAGAKLEKYKLDLLRVQQGLWQSQARAIIVFEGFDASGKGGAIRELTGHLDPRAIRVHPIGAPLPDEKAKHYLYRFWQALPAPGTLSIFDRSWYGRVLVERVEHLIPKHRWREAYEEINQFETMLTRDGVTLIKFFLGISKDEQFKRFEERLKDPYKQWKLGDADLEARAKWDAYVKAADEMFKRTHTRAHPWHLIAADDKDYARTEVLRTCAHALKSLRHQAESAARDKEVKKLMQGLERMRKL